MEEHLALPRHLRQIVQKSGRLATGRAVVQRKRLAQRMQPVRHRDHRCHADAAGKQQAQRGLLVQRKVIGRLGDENPAPFAERAVHQHGASAPPVFQRFAQNTQHILAPIGRIAGQAVLALVLGRDHDVDMGAGVERRQRRSVDRAELVLGHVRRPSPGAAAARTGNTGGSPSGSLHCGTRSSVSPAAIRALCCAGVSMAR